MIEENQKLEIGKIKELIHEVNGQYVILDADVAKLYGYNGGTKVINQTFKRNINKFPSNSFYQITNEELDSFEIYLKSLKVTSNVHGGSRKGHIVFTEEGIKILSGFLRKPYTGLVTPNILEAFKSLKESNQQNLAIPVDKGERIENLIYNIRGKQVMLDADLARIYECKNGTKTVVQTFKRNIERFPDDFYFQLTEDEFLNLRSQIGTANGNTMIRSLPFAFTEPGIYTLASILRTPIANKITTTIMRTFTIMKHYISSNLIEPEIYYKQTVINTQNIDKINKKIENLNEEFDNFKKVFNEFQSKNSKPLTYFKGQIYDAYSKISDIFHEAQKELIIIDSYADKTLLDMISDLNTKITLITKNNNLLKQIDIEKYKNQYNNLEIIYDSSWHDRYFILDKKIIYHCGASVNHAGAKTFSIIKFEDDTVCLAILNYIKKVIP